MESDCPPENGHRDNVNEREGGQQQREEDEQTQASQGQNPQAQQQQGNVVNQVSQASGGSQSQQAEPEEVVLEKKVTYEFHNYYGPIYHGPIQGDVMASKHEIKDSKFRNIEGSSQAPVPTPPVRFPALGAASHQMALQWTEQGSQGRPPMPMLPPAQRPPALGWHESGGSANDPGLLLASVPIEIPASAPTALPSSVPIAPPSSAPIALPASVPMESGVAAHHTEDVRSTSQPAEQSQPSTRRKIRRGRSAGSVQSPAHERTSTSRRLEMTPEHIGQGDDEQPRSRRARSAGRALDYGNTSHAFGTQDEEQTVPKTIHSQATELKSPIGNEEESFDETTHSFLEFRSDEDSGEEQSQPSTRRKIRRTQNAGAVQSPARDRTSSLRKLEMTREHIGQGDDERPRSRRTRSAGQASYYSNTSHAFSTQDEEQTIPKTIDSKEAEIPVWSEEESFDETTYSLQEFESDENSGPGEEWATVEAFTSGSMPEDDVSLLTLTEARSTRTPGATRNSGNADDSGGIACGFQQLGIEDSMTTDSSDGENGAESIGRRHRNRLSPRRRRFANLRAATSQTLSTETCNMESQTNVLLKGERTVQTEEEQTYEIGSQTEKPERRNRRCQVDYDSTYDKDTQTLTIAPNAPTRPQQNIFPVFEDFTQMARPEAYEHGTQTENKILTETPTQTQTKTFADNEFQTDPKEISQEGTQTDKQEDLSSRIFPADLIAEYKREEALLTEDFRTKHRNILPILDSTWQQIIDKTVVSSCEKLLCTVEKTEALCVQSCLSLARINLSKPDPLTSCKSKTNKIFQMSEELRVKQLCVHEMILYYATARLHKLCNKGGESINGITRCVSHVRSVFKSLGNNPCSRKVKLYIIYMIPLMHEMLGFLQSIQSSTHKVRVKAEARCLCYIGLCYYYCNEYLECANMNESAIELMKTEFEDEFQTYQIYARCLYNVGLMHEKMGNIDKAIELFKISLESYEKVKDWRSDKQKETTIKTIRNNLEIAESKRRK